MRKFFYWLYIYFPVALPSSKNLDPLPFNQSSPTNNYQTQKLNKNKTLKKKKKNPRQPNIRILASGILNDKYLVFRTPNTKSTIVRNISNAILKQQQ